MKKAKRVKLGKKDGAVIMRADGSNEVYLPSHRPDERVSYESPAVIAAVVGFLIHSKDGEYERLCKKYLDDPECKYKLRRLGLKLIDGGKVD